MRRMRLTLRRLLRDYPVLKLLLFVLLVWCIGAIVLRVAEGPKNPEFDSMPKAA